MNRIKLFENFRSGIDIDDLPIGTFVILDASNYNFEIEKDQKEIENSVGEIIDKNVKILKDLELDDPGNFAPYEVMYSFGSIYAWDDYILDSSQTNKDIEIRGLTKKYNL